MDYIKDKKGFATSLFEEAFGKNADDILENWKDYTSMVPRGSITNMLAAYKYSQDFKEELDFYGFLCFWLACHDRSTWASELAYYEEALRYCKQTDLKTCIQKNYEYSKELHEKRTYEGVHPSAQGRIEGIEKIAAVYGYEDWTLHDAEVKSISYDRDNNTLDIEVDTYIDQWAADNKSHIIPFHFSGILMMEINMDYGNDYFWTTHIYVDNNYIYAEFESANLRVCSKNLSIGDVE